MSDNLKIVQQKVEADIDPNGAPGSILAQNHQDILKLVLEKVGKYTGSPYQANKVITEFTPGLMSWESNAMNNIADFDLKFAKLTADLNDFGEVLSRISAGTLLDFKDYLGRHVNLIFQSYTADVDGVGNDIYIVDVKGVAQNINYVYQDAEVEACILSVGAIVGIEEIAIFDNNALYVSDAIGNDGTAEPLNILKPYKTLDAAYTEFKTNPAIYRIVILDGNDSVTYEINQSLLEQTVGKSIEIYAGAHIDANILINFVGSLITGANETQPEFVWFNTPGMSISTESTGAMGCDKICAGGIRFDCLQLSTNANFAGWKMHNGYINVAIINIDSNALFDIISNSKITVGRINFNGDNGRIADFASGTIEIDFGSIVANQRFFFIGFQNPNAGTTIVKHGSITTTYVPANSYLRVYGDELIVEYKDQITIQGNNYIDKNDGRLTLRGNASYPDTPYLINEHKTVDKEITLDNAEITVEKFVNANWNESVIFKNSILNVDDEVGTVGVSVNPPVVVMTPSVINQGTPASQLMLGGASVFDIYSALYSNALDLTGVTINNINTKL